MNWQPIETAPKDAAILLWAPGPTDDRPYWMRDPQSRENPPPIVVGRWFADHSIWVSERGEDDGYGADIPICLQPTHWRPLPEPPQ